jgi:hypothetical protein
LWTLRTFMTGRFQLWKISLRSCEKWFFVFFFNAQYLKIPAAKISYFRICRVEFDFLQSGKIKNWGQLYTGWLNWPKTDFGPLPNFHGSLPSPVHPCFNRLMVLIFTYVAQNWILYATDHQFGGFHLSLVGRRCQKPNFTFCKM